MWIEIRCDNRTSRKADGDGRARCYSHDNIGPMGESSDDRKSILRMVTGLNQEARGSGWVKIDGEWVCPYCSKTCESGASE